MKIPFPLAAVFLTLTLASAHAETYALLVGVGKYKNAAVPELLGPPHDINSLEAVLKGDFRCKNVTALRGRQATRVSILKALDEISAKLKQGDYFFFYFSGHGTSFYARGDLDFLSPDTGAVLPWDFDDSTKDTILNTLLIGKRDLRERFKQIDSKAQAFVVFDSCYSGNSMKSVGKVSLQDRYHPIALPADGAADRGDVGSFAERQRQRASAANGPTVKDWPYSRLIAISAASESQTAKDIKDPSRTLDQNPHGQLTNALLIGLKGAADKDHKGGISHEELFNFVQESSVGRWSHTPLLRGAEDNGRSLALPVFGEAKDFAIVGGNYVPGKTRVRIEGDAKTLTEQIRRLASVQLIASDDYDLLVKPVGSGYDLYHAGALALNAEPMQEDAVVARVGAQQDLEKLTNWKFASESFGVTLRLDPDGKGQYPAYTEISFQAKPDIKSYLLLLDIDQTGVVTIISPYLPAQRIASAAGKIAVLHRGTVESPFGQEILRLFAFEKEPPALASFLTKDKEGQPVRTEIPPGSPRLRELMTMIEKAEGKKAETKVSVVSVPRT